MDLIELNKIIKETYTTIPTINSVYNGDVYNEWTNNPKILYSSMVFDVKSMIVNDNTIDFTYTFYLGDRLVNDATNYNEIYESNYKALERGISLLYQNENILGVGGNRNYTFVRQKFSDILAVAFVDVTITVGNDTDRC